MKPGLEALYARLADGERHNGAELARELGITRAAVWKRMEALRRLGLDIEGSAGDGYRLAHPVERLDADLITSALHDERVTVAIAGAVDSTNARLLAEEPAHGRALLAEAQTGGRGRRGRSWLSPLGAGVYLSLAWRFESGLAGLAPLSPLVGLTVALTLDGLTPGAVKVKWPNDLLLDDAKLGGCLVEVSGAAEGPCRAVVGVGINLFRSASAAAIDQRWTALAEHGNPPGRNALAAAVLDALAAALGDSDRHGFESRLACWRTYDALADRPVRLLRDGRPDLDGIARGIDDHGRLRLETGEAMLAFGSGEVSVRVR
jgi:BirA family biotin operon repressor/biotin-[acetyl-CoA-carboxylase] ligase